MKKVLQITYTAVLIALLVLLQAVTKAGGQLLTGSCVNAVLAIAAVLFGAWNGVAVALVSPFLAFILGVGPQIVPVVPIIAIGNVIYVLILHFLSSKKNFAPWRQATGLLCAAICKFLALYLGVVKLLCAILSLPEKQVATLSTMFSWPQLLTALIGGSVALWMIPVLRKALRR